MESAEFPATGTQNTSGKAKGKITIYNSYSTQVQKFVPSRFQSESGKIFWTIVSVNVPGIQQKWKGCSGEITTDVVAAEGEILIIFLLLNLLCRLLRVRLKAVKFLLFLKKL